VQIEITDAELPAVTRYLSSIRMTRAEKLARLTVEQRAEIARLESLTRAQRRVERSLLQSKAMETYLASDEAADVLKDPALLAGLKADAQTAASARAADLAGQLKGE
jgi:hypothetical protein